MNAQKNALRKANHRLAVAFHVNENQQGLSVFIEHLNYNRKLIISSLIEDALVPEKATTQLGEEYDLVVFDARVVFNPNALGAVAGVLCGGGCLLLVLPTLEKWRNNTSLFLSHVDRLLRDQTGVIYFSDNTYKPNVSQVISLIEPMSNNLLPYRTENQKQVVNTVVSALQKNDPYCCTLTSGRGRGKTSALGFMAFKLLEQNNVNLLISAPKLSVVEPLFQHINNQCLANKLNNFIFQKSKFQIKNSSLHFIAPDLLLDTLPKADVLFIDEAAAIPLSMLEQLLAHYSKIIFSTTTHGYEGSGRGFILKFHHLLDNAKPGWQKIEMHQPIRWSYDDPVEKWIEALLFLNVKPQKMLELTDYGRDSVSLGEVKLIDRAHLINDELKLAAIFSLLIFSHYRTSPSDFQTILDSKNVRLYSLEYQQNLLGVVVVNQEGGFDAALSKAIYQGERRPKGHLLAQTLCFHGGCEAAAILQYARIMRIAIQPEYQHRGMGCYLLGQVIKNEKARGMDVVGSSFSATVPLLNFWRYADMPLLRVGFSRDHVSASHSVVVAKALTGSGARVVEYLNAKFCQNIMLWLAGPLFTLPEDLKKSILLASLQCKFEGSEPFDIDDVNSFARFNRNYEACMPAIMRFIETLISKSQNKLTVLSDPEKRMIELSYEYMHDWSSIVKQMQASGFSVSGKAQAKILLRAALKGLLDAG